MSNNVPAQSFTVWPLASILTIVFVVLKLTDVIGWSWIWVLSPLWISFALFVVLTLLVVGVAALGVRAANKRAHERWKR